MTEYTVVYTWIGTFDVEATDEDDALAQVQAEVEAGGGDPRALFDLDDETFEIA